MLIGNEPFEVRPQVCVDFEMRFIQEPAVVDDQDGWINALGFQRGEHFFVGGLRAELVDVVFRPVIVISAQVVVPAVGMIHLLAPSAEDRLFPPGRCVFALFLWHTAVFSQIRGMLTKRFVDVFAGLDHQNFRAFPLAVDFGVAFVVELQTEAFAAAVVIAHEPGVARLDSKTESHPILLFFVTHHKEERSRCGQPVAAEIVAIAVHANAGILVEAEHALVG